MTHSILLIGNAGQVGWELQQTLSPVGKVVGVARDSLRDGTPLDGKAKRLDLSQPDSLRSLIHETKPNLIVNAAAYTAVDQAETDIDSATAVNATAPAILAETAQSIGAALIHISTDYVFDGQHYLPYLESDRTSPLGIYGKTKLAGEQGILAIAHHHPDFRHVILRTAWVYGTHGKGNFVKTMLRLGAEREELRVVCDQIGTPTWAVEIAKAIASLSNSLLSDSPIDSGIYHFTNSGVASWYDFAVAIFEEAHALGFPLNVRRIIPITTAEYPTPAQRPAFSVLSCQKITPHLGAPPPQWRQSLREMLKEFKSQINLE
jgi:dTDP-4-dehydrorhamnose reductase